jgi:hypothetical protein
MKYTKNQGEEYINGFPQFKKWINQCTCCQVRGYNPSMPDHIGDYDKHLGAYYIKKYFKPLSINEDGLCEQCYKLTKNNKIPH